MAWHANVAKWLLCSVMVGIHAIIKDSKINQFETLAYVTRAKQMLGRTFVELIWGFEWLLDYWWQWCCPHWPCKSSICDFLAFVNCVFRTLMNNQGYINLNFHIVQLRPGTEYRVINETLTKLRNSRKNAKILTKFCANFKILWELLKSRNCHKI